VFGVNVADGRIKGYGLRDPRGRDGKAFYVLYACDNPSYGRNDFPEAGANPASGLCISCRRVPDRAVAP